MENASMPQTVVKMKGIVKQFPGILANDHVNFQLKRSSIHALLGENGAGKSTLMNILAGLYKPEHGSIEINGQVVEVKSPRHAIELGIGMIHQHFMLVPSLSVTENILMGLNQPAFFLNHKHYHEKIHALGQQYGLDVDPRAKVWQLSVGEQQRVEILKMLYRGAQILIMDEPTAVLSPKEAEGLFVILKNMINQGKSIVFISHKLNEVIQIADEVTVLRKGSVSAANINPQSMTRAELAKLMVGREVLFSLEKKPQQPGEVVLEVKDLQAKNDKGLPALQGLSFNVHAGEIVGLAGVAGNGQRELADVITGLRKCTGGKIIVHGEDATNSSAHASIAKGISHIPEDRTHVGTAPNLSMVDNVIMKNYQRKPIANGWVINQLAADNYAKELKSAYDIIISTIKTPVRLLSGGNLQRVILAREISSHPMLMIAMQPTRGLDVGAIEGVQRLLLAQRDAGSAILLVSEELEELLALSDRICIIYEGKIMGEVVDGDLEKIGQMMTGTPLSEIKATGVQQHD